jgi:hypothetical protein
VVSSTRAYISALNKMISWAAEASAGEWGCIEVPTVVASLQLNDTFTAVSGAAVSAAGQLCVVCCEVKGGIWM